MKTTFPPFFDNLIWLDSKEAAAYLRISINALRIMVYKGKLKPKKLERRLRFKRAELDKKLEASKGAFDD